MAKLARNPYAPGAGHSPPYLAGREQEIKAFKKFLKQDTIRQNVVLTGLRGTGKTVLMEDKYKPIAQADGWAWVGSDFSESTFLSEENLCLRILTDLSVFTSSLSIETSDGTFGFVSSDPHRVVDYSFLATVFTASPGLIADKLKATLDLVWGLIDSKAACKGVVFAYDEAQVVRDREDKEQYPLATLLETFQSIQRKDVRFLLLLTGLPTLFPKLVESRTYAERMFTVQELGRLTADESRKAIERPLAKSRWTFTEAGVAKIVEVSNGYPYFIQFICRETFDHLLANPGDSNIPMDSIIRKLDSDFFAGHWDKVTDRQRDVLFCAANLDNADGEFTIGEIADVSKSLDVKSLSPGDVSQILPRLIDKGLVYKNRFGKYCFAVPLFSGFIRRQYSRPDPQQRLF